MKEHSVDDSSRMKNILNFGNFLNNLKIYIYKRATKITNKSLEYLSEDLLM